jgi:RNA-directed DNA polymerase
VDQHGRTGDREADQPEDTGLGRLLRAFYPSALYPVLRRINTYLLRWIMKKYKKHSTWKKAIRKLADAAAAKPRHFPQWACVKPAAG